MKIWQLVDLEGSQGLGLTPVLLRFTTKIRLEKAGFKIEVFTRPGRLKSFRITDLIFE